MSALKPVALPIALPVAQAGLTPALRKGVRLPKPTILESFDSASGWSPNGLTLEVDAVNKVQGAAALKFIYNGIQYGAATKSNIGKYDFTKAGGTTLAWHQRYPMDAAAARNGSGFRIAQSGSFPGSSSIYDGGGLIMGGRWNSMHTSEVPYLATLNPAVNLWLKNGSGNPTAPYDGYVINDCLMADARGLSTVVLTFDDNRPSQVLTGLPILAGLGLASKCTFYIATGLINTSGRMTEAHIETALSYGADIQLSLDPTDSVFYNVNASVSEVMDKLLASREWLRVRGYNDYAQHFCYPEGKTEAVTTDPAHPFFYGKLQEALRANGFLSGRTTSFYQTYSRYGVSDQGLYLGGCGVSGQDDAGTRQYAEKAILRGTTCVYYMHEVGPEGSINIGTARFTTFAQWLRAQLDAKALNAVMSVKQWWQRDCANPATPPAA